MNDFDLKEIEYIDIHSHLQTKSFDEDRENVIERMKENKVATICIGADFSESLAGKKLAEENKNIFYSIGLHPHDNLTEFDFAFQNQEKYFQDLKDIGDSEKCVAVGECGLDYFYIYKDFEARKINKEEFEEKIKIQKEIFKRHIELARDLGLSLMLHIRPSEFGGNKEDAYLDAIETLKSVENIKGNFHFFVGNTNVLNKILQELPTFTFSIPAVCTFTNEYNEMIKAIPLDKIHIETDSPFVLPKNRRREAKQNEPVFVIDVFDKVCEIKDIKNKEEFRNILKENFKNIFLK